MRKSFKIFTFLLCFVFVTITGWAKDVDDSSEKKSHVYFVRVSKYATHAIYYVLDSDSLININEEINWFRYDCDPGNHLFWITNRDHHDFMTTDLKAGESYVVMIDVRVGFGKTDVRLDPKLQSDHDFIRAISLIENDDPTITSEEDLLYKTKSLNKKKVIKKLLEKYENQWKQEKEYKHLDDTYIINDSLLIK